MNASIIPLPLQHAALPSWSLRHHRLPNSIPTPWRSWLLDRGSLTARLIHAAPGRFRVHVIRECHTRPSPLEQRMLGLSDAQRVWVRDVVLYVDQHAVVIARTAIPDTTLRGADVRLKHLGNRSLGSYLFKQPSLQRTPLRASFDKTRREYPWGRYSVFRVHGKPLMVSEWFNVAIMQLTHSTTAMKQA
ncbi:MAG: chorismate lyase [Bacterioplanes sp.]|nr:chorismate lyase [Bacterioplanes sp.]